MSPQDVSFVLREFSPKRRTPPSALLGETQRRFIERYGYWPSSLHEAEVEEKFERLVAELENDSTSREHFRNNTIQP